MSSAHAKNTSCRNGVETLCVEQKTSCSASKRLALSLSAVAPTLTWHSGACTGCRGLGCSAGVTFTSTFTDFTSPFFTVCFANITGFFSLERTDNGRDVGPDHIELRVLARGIAASDPLLCGRARLGGNLPSRQPTDMHYRVMQLTQHRHAAIFVCSRLIPYYIAYGSSTLMNA